jgi:replicative DNA helicase
MLNLNTNIIQETLGCALMDARAADKVLVLDISDLVKSRDKAVLTAMKSLSAKGKPINLITMNAELKDEYTEYLIECQNLVSSTVFVDHYIRDIKEDSKRRKIRAAATELYNAAQDGSKSLEELTAEFTARIDGIADIAGGTVSAREAVLAFVDGIERKDEAKGVVGIPLLDKSLGSLSGGRLYVVGARPATGKTALAISAAYNTCVYGTVLFCSYEMQPSEIMGRILARLSRVDSQDISYKTLTDAQMQRLSEQYDTAGKLPIRFGVNCHTPEKVRAEALRIKDLRMVVIDYLQLMSSGRRAESRRVEVGQISRSLKQLSIELNVPVLALSQLNRNSEGSAKPPTMSEMRESGDIEQDADAIVLMYQLPNNGDSFVQTCEASGFKPVRLLLDKNRQGKSGVAIDTAFDGSSMTFISKSAVMEAGR